MNLPQLPPVALPAALPAAAAFGPSRSVAPGLSRGGGDRTGSGGVTGTFDGATVPGCGRLAGLSTLAPGAEGDAGVVAAEGRPLTLPAAALAAVVALAAVTAGLVRTTQAARTTR